MKNKIENLADMESSVWGLINGTSYHGNTFRATVNELIELVGKPFHVDNSGQDKTTHEWAIYMLDRDEVFTIYDWKRYSPLHPDLKQEWHIGARSASTARAGVEILQELRSQAVWETDVPV